MTIRLKLIIGSLLLTAIPLAITSLILGYIAINNSSEAIHEQFKEHLISIRETKKHQIEDYFATAYEQILNTAKTPAIRTALKAMTEATDNYKVDGSTLKNNRLAVSNYYKNKFGKNYKNQNAGKNINTNDIVSKLSDSAVLLQADYIVNNQNPPGEKHKLNSNNSGSDYDQAHQQVHPYISDFVKRFGYYDFFLVSQSGTVVYSTFKETDFASNLINGPFSNSSLASAFKRSQSANEGSIIVEDFLPYLPSYNSPAAFIATPVFDHGKRIGVLIFQMAIDRINAIMTNQGKWKEVGLGLSGESYLIGPDKKARSISRFLLTAPEEFKQSLLNAGVNKDIVNAIAVRGSNIGIQEINTSATGNALNGQTGFEELTDYRNVSVLSAYTPIDVAGLKWGIVAEIDSEEALARLHNMTDNIISSAIMVSIIILLVAALLGYLFAVIITKPIVKLESTIVEINQNADLSKRVELSSNDEVGNVAKAFNNMLDKFHESLNSISESSVQLAAAAEELSCITVETNQAIETQHIETEQVATAMNEMTATVQEVANSAASAAEAAKQADNKTIAGQKVVQGTVDVVNQLAQEIESTADFIKSLAGEADNIGSVIDVIRAIAEQTNLLALNAAIEAARAGDQGRGFSVVADEVRSLAGRTQASTVEIQAMIERLQTEANRAVEAMGLGQQKAETGVSNASEAGEALGSIADSVMSINDLNVQIATASEEQSAVAEEINRNIININQTSQQSATSASQISEASEELAKLAISLQELLGGFKL